MRKEHQFLYRGINHELYKKTRGILVPKSRDPFEFTFQLDGSFFFDGSATLGPSVQNAVLRHELRQEGFPTAGISTTPFFERAQFYATGGRTHSKGYVVRIDRERLAGFGVREYVVADWVPYPSVPEDEEVIIVAADCGPLPSGILVEVIEVFAK
jgi:hypothetical protein